MILENKRCNDLKAKYLRKVEKALSSVKHPRRKEVLEDVRTHLERRFAELEPEKQTPENLQSIINEMGPASDYAELLDTHTTIPMRSACWKYGSLLGLGAIIVMAAILFTTTMHEEKVGYIMTFQAVAPFSPRTAAELLAAFNENHPSDVRTHHFRTSIHGDRLKGHIVVDTERARQAIEQMINKNSKLILVNTRHVTLKDFETHKMLGQPSLSYDEKKQHSEMNTQKIDVKQTNADSKAGNNNQYRISRLRSPSSRNETVSRSGSWPDGDCFIHGRVYRKAHFNRIGHAKVCLSSEEFGTWIVEAEDHGNFDFRYIPAGIYTLQSIETYGYQDSYYNPENQTTEKPSFQLKKGERKSVNIEIKPVRPYRRITGRILDKDDKPIKNGSGFCVYTWVKRPHGRWKGHYQRISLSGVDENGGYMLEELDGRPVYVQVYDYNASTKDNPYPPRFYPGTYSRAAAKLVTFGDDDIVGNIDITLAKTGGLVLEGLVTNESTGEPVSEALVSIFHHDMCFDLFCGYTDEQGRYRIEGLGEGMFIVHVDAVHKGLVKTRKLVTINPDSQETHLDFTLRSGVTISGKFVDNKGSLWLVGQNFGRAYVEVKPGGGVASNFVYGNKYAPAYIKEGTTIFSEEGQGDHTSTMMVFPTDSSFLLPAVMPGKIIFDFRPRGRGERLLKILYQGKDVSKSGLITQSGQTIYNVTIVIGTTTRF